MRQAPSYEFYLGTPYKWAISLGLGGFLYAFLVVFLPFGVSNYDPNHQYRLDFFIEIGYIGLATIGLAALNEFFVKPLVIRRARLNEVLAWSTWLLVCLGLGIYVMYNILGNWHDFSLGSAVGFVLNCASVLIFPMVGIFFYFRYRSLSVRYWEMRVNWQQEKDPNQLLRFEGQGKNEGFAVAAADFRFARAQDNYVALYYVKNGQLRSELLRTTLAEISDTAGYSGLIRCHRSFLVNLNQVHSFTDGHPLLLTLRDVPEPIRVSRSYRQAVLSRLRPASSPA